MQQDTAQAYTPDDLQQFATDALSKGNDPAKVSKVLQNHGYTLNADGTVAPYNSGGQGPSAADSLSQTYRADTNPISSQAPQANPNSVAPGQGPSVGGFANNAMQDVGNLATGILSIPGAVGTAISDPKKGGDMVKSMVDNTLSEYNQLLGKPVKNDN